MASTLTTLLTLLTLLTTTGAHPPSNSSTSNHLPARAIPFAEKHYNRCRYRTSSDGWTQFDIHLGDWGWTTQQYNNDDYPTPAVATYLIIEHVASAVGGFGEIAPRADWILHGPPHGDRDDPFWGHVLRFAVVPGAEVGRIPMRTLVKDATRGLRDEVCYEDQDGIDWDFRGVICKQACDSEFGMVLAGWDGVQYLSVTSEKREQWGYVLSDVAVNGVGGWSVDKKKLEYDVRDRDGWVWSGGGVAGKGFWH